MSANIISKRKYSKGKMLCYECGEKLEITVKACQICGYKVKTSKSIFNLILGIIYGVFGLYSLQVATIYFMYFRDPFNAGAGSFSVFLSIIFLPLSILLIISEFTQSNQAQPGKFKKIVKIISLIPVAVFFVLVVFIILFCCP